MIETVVRPAVVLGGDLGGTSTRVLVARADGRRLGTGRAGPGNPTSSPELAASSLAAALATALQDVDPAAVQRVVLGVAGGSALTAGPRREEFAAVLSGAGLRVAPEYVGDVHVAYAAGTAAADGGVLVAGTGASVGQVRGGRLVRTASGHGWLLGDDGSGYWLGREAVRAALVALDAGQVPAGLPRTTLALLAERAGLAGPESLGEVPRAVDEPARTAWKRLVVHTVTSRSPVRLADLARLVTEAAEGGDGIAQDVVRRAGSALAASVAPLLVPDGPLVLAGGLVGPGAVVTAAVQGALADQGRAPNLVHAGPGEAGAAWLALAPPGSPVPDAAAVRERLGLPA